MLGLCQYFYHRAWGQYQSAHATILCESDGYVVSSARQLRSLGGSLRDGVMLPDIEAPVKRCECPPSVGAVRLFRSRCDIWLLRHICKWPRQDSGPASRAQRLPKTSVGVKDGRHLIDGSKQVGIARKQPSSVLLRQDGQCMTSARQRLNATRRRYDHGELGPHESPVSKDLDFFNLAGAVKLGSTLAGFGLAQQRRSRLCA